MLDAMQPETSNLPDGAGRNLFTSDPALLSLAQLYIPAPLLEHLSPHLHCLGAMAGGRLDALAAAADQNKPVMHHRTRTGEDRQRIEKNPAYTEMERLAFAELGIAALSHRGGVLDWPDPMPPAAKYLLVYLFVQAEFGLMCPVSMTDSLARTLRRFGDPALVARYLPALTSQDMDGLAQGAMFMTEAAAGSDIAATTVRALPDGDDWRLWGEKWFCSNPDAALAMVLARPEGAAPGISGVSLFLLPRVLPDGTANAYRIVRLKDKLGTRSMASGEITLQGATAYLVGEPGAGMRQMADMVNNSRLSNGVRAAGLMRRALSEALHVARNRSAFGERLIDKPLMRRQLAKMLIRTEQARTMMFQAAEALRRADTGDADAYALLRVLTPLLKFRACRDARVVTGDAMEVRGGCGYIEEWPEPRLLRDAHLGSIWEGTSNIVALDVRRADQRDGGLAALRAHVGARDASVLPLLDRAIAMVRDGGDVNIRQAASALYHLTTVAAMRWEGARVPGREMLADLVLTHRVLPRDPLAPPAELPDRLFALAC
jgi:alkylation response protein AidB-like acyl-CoA dehydrogenase